MAVEVEPFFFFFFFNRKQNVEMLSRMMASDKCYVTCGHIMFMTWPYPFNNSDVM